MRQKRNAVKTLEEAIEIAKSYTYSKHLYKNNNSAWRLIEKANLMTVVFPKRRSFTRHTNEELQQEALKYKTKKEFILCSPKHYNAIKKRGLIPQYCSHMIKTQHSIGEEVVAFVLETVLKEKPIRNNKKLLTSTLELDIYFPSYNFAVEYDGLYWHNSERKKINDQKTNETCLQKGINLIRIKEDNTRFYDLQSQINYVKQQIIEQLDTINNITNKNIFAEDIISLTITPEDIFKIVFDWNDIKKLITESPSLIYFIKTYPDVYARIRRYKLGYLLENLKRKFTPYGEYCSLSKEDFIKYVVANFQKYSEFHDHKIYQYALRKKYINDIKPFFADLHGRLKCA